MGICVSKRNRDTAVVAPCNANPCSICLEQMGVDVLQLACHPTHKFHWRCLAAAWRNAPHQGLRCPTCRRQHKGCYMELFEDNTPVGIYCQPSDTCALVDTNDPKEPKGPTKLVSIPDETMWGLVILGFYKHKLKAISADNETTETTSPTVVPA